MSDILDTEISTNEQLFQVQVSASETESKTGVGIQLSFQIREKNTEICSVSYTSEITNPIDLVAITITAASAYGLCVGKRYTGSTAKILYRSYNESKEESPDSGLWNRCQDSVGRLKDKSQDFKEEAVSVLVGCIPGSGFFTNHNEE